MSKIYLVDGSSYIFRAFHAISHSLSNGKGMPTNALYGFLAMLRKLLETEEPEFLTVVFDPFKPDSVNFRKQIYPQYKANRPPMPEDLSVQIPWFTKLLDAMNIHHTSLDHYEADDVIATITRLARAQQHDVYIVGSDKDLLQLVDDEGVCMIDTMSDKLYDVAETVRKFGVPPKQVIYVQALAGDSSDNVPGVPGIGIKTAGQLISDFGSLDNLLDNIDSVTGAKRKENLRNFAESARISLDLVTLRDHCDISWDIECSRLKQPNSEQLHELFEFLRFRKAFSEIRDWAATRGWDLPIPASVTPPTTSQNVAANTKKAASSGKKKALQKPSDDSPQQSLLLPTNTTETTHLTGAADSTTETTHLTGASIDKNYQTILTEEQLQQTFDAIRAATQSGLPVGFDLETTSLDVLKAEIVGLSFSWSDHQGVYIPVAHRTLDAPPQLPLQQVLDLFKPLLEAKKPLFIAQNAKYEFNVLQNYGITFSAIALDTMLASYVLNPDPPTHSHSLDSLALDLLNAKTITYEQVTGKGKSAIPFDQVHIEAATTYAAEDADLTRLIAKKLTPNLSQNPTLLNLYQDLELPLVEVLSKMERTGICINTDLMHQLSQDFGAKMNDLQKEIDLIAKRPLNPNSPTQLREVLFDSLDLPVIKRTKTGPSTDASVLQELTQHHALPQLILDYRSLSKLKGTYVDALPELINPITGRIHTDFNQTIAATGRLSSSNPNLQNIPIRSSQGQEIRRAFVPQQGWKLICADYSQIELRIMAHMSEDPVLIQAYLSGADIHQFTAHQVFDVPLDAVLPEQRRAAKAINFGIIYGMGPRKLAQQLHTSLSEAKSMIQAYFERYQGVARFMKALVEEARQTGWCSTLWGRRRYLPAIHGKGQLAAFAERVAVNSPIQGTAADIIKKAMIDLHRELSERKLEANLLLQVHDELVLEASPEHLLETHDLVKSTMESVVQLHIPLIADIGTGDNWLDAK